MRSARPFALGHFWRILALAAGGAGVVLVAVMDQSRFAAYDVVAYWAVNGSDPYRVHVAPSPMAFLYSPPIAWLFDPLGWLPWDVARGGWAVLQAFALVVMTGPWALPLALLTPVHDDLMTGNIGLFMAAAMVVGIRRWPAAWALLVLTKVTPVVGLAWYAGRRDWRGLAVACATIGVIVTLSFLVAPSQWLDWFGVLRENTTVTGQLDLGPLWLRLLMAAAACFWAGRTNRAWVVPLVVALSLGHIWFGSLSIAVAAIPLRRPER